MYNTAKQTPLEPLEGHTSDSHLAQAPGVVPATAGATNTQHRQEADPIAKGLLAIWGVVSSFYLVWLGVDYYRLRSLFLYDVFDPSVKLADHALVKEWELLQTIGSFIFSAGVISNFVPSVFTSAAVPKTLVFVGYTSQAFINGLTLVLLLMTVVASFLARVLSSQMWSICKDYQSKIQRYLLEKVEPPWTEKLPDYAKQTRQLYLANNKKERMHNYVVSLVVLSVLSKLSFTVALVLWLTSILLYAAHTYKHWVFDGLLGIVIGLVVTAMLAVLVASVCIGLIFEEYHESRRPLQFELPKVDYAMFDAISRLTMANKVPAVAAGADATPPANADIP